MNRHDDIRQIMGLMENASLVLEQAPNEAEVLADKIVDLIKSKIDADPTSGYPIIENLYDLIDTEFFSKEPDDYHDRLVAQGWPEDPNKEFKMLNKKFKAKFGMGLYAYADKAEDTVYDQDVKSVQKDDKKFFELLTDKLTVNVGPRWAAENLKYYTSSTKVYVEDEGRSFPTAVFARPSFERLGVDKEGLIAWLESKGIKKKKRPKAPKYTPPMYD